MNQLDLACSQFRTLLEEQLRRIENMNDQKTDFAAKNTILSSHDIIVVSLLLSRKVYPFVPDDWCGYVHGAVLFLQENGTWQLAYTAPEGDERRRAAIFV